jgi:hypothetical protein
LQVLRRARPGDIVEEIWSSDIVNLTWEIWRIRRMMSKLIAEAIAEILPSILSPITKADAHSEWMKALIKGWSANRPSAIRRVDKYLASANVSFDVVNVHAFLSEIDNVERLDRLITIAEARRNAAIREPIGIEQLLRKPCAKRFNASRTPNMKKWKPPQSHLIMGAARTTNDYGSEDRG